MAKRVLAGLFVILLLVGSVFFYSRQTTSSISVDPPTQLKVSMNDGNFSVLNWSGDPNDCYRIYRRECNDDDFHYLSDVYGLTYQDTTLTMGKDYVYKINILKAGNEYEGAEITFTSYNPTPEHLSLSISDFNVKLTWDAIPADSFTVYASRDGVNWSILSKTTLPSFTCKLADNSRYFAVSALHQQENGEYIESDKCSPVAILDAPQINSAVILNSKIHALIFTESDEAEMYTIYRSTTPEGPFIPIAHTISGVFYDYDPPLNALYRVQAVAPNSSSNLSDIAFAEPCESSIFTVPVFMYHDFATQKDIDEGILFDEYSIWASEFAEDLIYLQENGFTTITCQMLIDCMSGKTTLPEKPVLLTIDDGKYGVYKTAWPLLQKYHMCASLAVIGELIDEATGDPLTRSDIQAPFCTWNELEEMSSSGAIEIISHTYYDHRFENDGRVGANISTELSERAFLRHTLTDFTLMQRTCDAKIGTFVPVLAYPYSRHSDTSDRAWFTAGYQLLLSGDYYAANEDFGNPILTGIGCNPYSAIISRRPRMTGTSIADYFSEAGLFTQVETPRK